MYREKLERLDKVPLHILRFDTLNEQLQALNLIKKKLKASHNGTWTDFASGRADNWIGRHFNSFEEILKTTDETWDEGMMIYRMMMARLKDAHLPEPQTIRRRRSYSPDDGAEVNVDKYLRGDDYWESTTRSHMTGPTTITVLTDISTSGGVDTDNILWRGAAAICLTELLEKAGYRVELWSVKHVTRFAARTRGDMAVGVCLKRPDEPLDVATHINAVCGWSMRTISLMAYYLTGYEPAGGYGCPTPIEQVVSHFTPDEKAVIVEQVWNDDTAVELVREFLADLKVK